MEDGGSDGCLRWHFPPLWPTPQAHCHTSPTSCLVVFPLTTISFSHTCLLGRLSFATFLRSCLINSHFWDSPGVLGTRLLWSHCWPHSRISFLASIAQHSGDWLFTLSIASCCLQSDDEAVRVAVGRRLGLNLCSPHECRCGSVVDARGLHSFDYKKAPVTRQDNQTPLSEWLDCS